MTISAAEVLMQTECDCDTCGNLSRKLPKECKGSFQEAGRPSEKKNQHSAHLYIHILW